MTQNNDRGLVGTAVVDRDGRPGRIVAPPASPDAASPAKNDCAVLAENDCAVLIEFSHGRTVLVGRDLLVLETDGTLRLPMGADELDPSLDELATRDVRIRETEVIPLAEEQVRVTKRRVVTGGVRVRKHVREREEVIDEPLTRVRVEVERRPLNVWADTPPPVRTEGDTIVVPLLEEVLVAERRLRVTEEVRITRRRESFRAPQRVVLRREEAEVERVAADEAGDTEESVE